MCTGWNVPLGMSSLMGLLDLNRPDLKDTPFVPAMPPQMRDLKTAGDIFAAMRRQDILLHHPFDSFMPVLDFVRAAAIDPDVLAIKQTLYRVGQNAPVVRALLEAQRNGKQVAVLVELKARFDEESNIVWAKALEAEGVHVAYGLVGLKTHAKITLVVRKEAGHLRRYLHLSTGNYNAVTAQIYTDVGLLTCDPELCADASDLFNTLTGYSTQTYYRSLLVAPVTMRERLEALIEREIAHQLAGRPSRLILKMNALVDDRLIRALYRASQVGVRADLLVRGICCLRPGLPGISDSIRVTSVVGPVPRAQPHLLLRERRQSRGIRGQRRPDAAQPRSPGGNTFPDQGPAASAATCGMPCSRPSFTITCARVSFSPMAPMCAVSPRRASRRFAANSGSWPIRAWAGAAPSSGDNADFALFPVCAIVVPVSYLTQEAYTMTATSQRNAPASGLRSELSA